MMTYLLDGDDAEAQATDVGAAAKLDRAKCLELGTCIGQRRTCPKGAFGHAAFNPIVIQVLCVGCTAPYRIFTKTRNSGRVGYLLTKRFD